jgi:hypothetical protein
VERDEEASVREDLLAARSAGSPVVELAVEEAAAVVVYGTGDADEVTSSSRRVAGTRGSRRPPTAPGAATASTTTA